MVRAGLRASDTVFFHLLAKLVLHVITNDDSCGLTSLFAICHQYNQSVHDRVYGDENDIARPPAEGHH